MKRSIEKAGRGKDILGKELVTRRIFKLRWQLVEQENASDLITLEFIAFSLKSPKVSAHGHGGGPWSDRQDLISVDWLLMY